jgi:hypothetical protein
VDAQERKSSSPTYIPFTEGIWARRTCGAETTPEDIRANDKESVGIDRFAWSDEIFPPARFGGSGGRDLSTARSDVRRS